MNTLNTSSIENKTSYRISNPSDESLFVIVELSEAIQTPLNCEKPFEMLFSISVPANAQGYIVPAFAFSHLTLAGEKMSGGWGSHGGERIEGGFRVRCLAIQGGSYGVILHLLLKRLDSELKPLFEAQNEAKEKRTTKTCAESLFSLLIETLPFCVKAVEKEEEPTQVPYVDDID